ncbi:TPA: dual specificity protein phosphatase family protein [Bacillus cereus]|nr:dual specificity protein phosphatase family protein [Bacillus cereus]
MIQRISENLYIGNWQDAIMMDQDIEAVLNLKRYNYIPARHVKSYKQIPWMYIDDPNHMEKLEEAVKFIFEQVDNLKRKTFIHCTVGVDRTLGVTLCYLIKKGMTYEEALLHLKSLNLIIPRQPVKEVIIAVQNYANNCRENV